MPEFYIAYNGKRPFNKEYLAFGNGFLQVNTKLVDIRFDSLNDQQPSNALAGYAYFIKCMDVKKSDGVTDDEAFVYATQQCKKEGFLTGVVDKEDFIMYQEAMIRVLFPTDEERAEHARIEAMEEGLKEGLEQGREEGRIVVLLNKIHRKTLKSKTREQIIDELEMSEDEIKILGALSRY